MYIIGKINKDVYKCVAEDIESDEVVITDNQIQHIKEKHPNDFERFSKYFEEVINDPDYIIETNKLNTALILKKIIKEQEVVKMVVRLIASVEQLSYKNSIITFMKIDEKEWNRLLRNKTVLYKRE